MPASETWTELLWKDLANWTVSENNELGRNLHEVYDDETTTMTAMMTATSVLFWRQNDVVPVTAGRSAGGRATPVCQTGRWTEGRTDGPSRSTERVVACVTYGQHSVVI